MENLKGLNLGEFVAKLRETKFEQDIVSGFKNDVYRKYGHGTTTQNYPHGVKVFAEYGDPTDFVIVGSVKRKIKSHKGGRSASLTLRLSPDEKQMLQDKADKFRVPKIDLILEAVKKLRKI